jgi:aspartate/methionine/tyrosine aminotransferase
MRLTSASPPDGATDHLSTLAAEGWGVIALSPTEGGKSARAAWVDIVVEQVTTFLDDDYEVALVEGADPAIREFVSALAEGGREVTRVLAFGEE